MKTSIEAQRGEREPESGERAAPQQAGSSSRRSFITCAGALGLSVLGFQRFAGSQSAPEAVGGLGARSDSPRRPIKGMVVAPQPLAVEAGVTLLRAGGNAVDAAVAAAFVQGILSPFSCGLGGFGCLLVYSAKDRRATMIDFHGRAGSKATPDIFVDSYEGPLPGHSERSRVRGDINQIGYRSVTTPGTVAGLHEAWSRFGRVAWSQLFEPAIRLAEQGVDVPRSLFGIGPVSAPAAPGYVSLSTKVRATAESARIFLNNNRGWKAGDRLIQLDYARTLKAIAQGGPEVFYQGDIAERIVADFRKNGGLITREDLESYRPRVYDALRGTYRGHDIVSNRLPGSGVQVIQILNILDGYECGSMDHGKSPYIELVARAHKLTFIDRAKYHGDPEFVKDESALLMSKQRAVDLRRLIERRELPTVSVSGEAESPDTTSLAAVDEDGNCVALIHTLGAASGVVTPGLGFTYNNCMFQYHPLPGRPNSIEPGKARITALCPAMVFRDGQPLLLAGASGGNRILTAVQHLINNVIDHRMTVVEGTAAPRWHWEEEHVELEPRLFHHVRSQLETNSLSARLGTSFAVLQAISIEPGSKRWHGASDHRGNDGGGVATA